MVDNFLGSTSAYSLKHKRNLYKCVSWVKQTCLSKNQTSKKKKINRRFTLWHPHEITCCQHINADFSGTMHNPKKNTIHRKKVCLVMQFEKCKIIYKQCYFVWIYDVLVCPCLEELFSTTLIIVACSKTLKISVSAQMNQWVN